MSVRRLSVPSVRTRLPRPLTDDEREALTRVADALCGPSARAEAPSMCDEYPAQLEVALATRVESFELVVGTCVGSSGTEDLVAWLRRLHDEDGETFQAVSAVLGGAYLMVTSVREAVGYPGQRRDPAGIEEAVNELEDILDPVLERGHFYVDPSRAS